MFRSFLASGMAAVLYAQPPAPLTYAASSQPITVALTCTAEDVQELNLACSPEQPCPVFLEISSVAAVGNKLFLAGNLHTAAVTLASLLLASADAGQTWKEPLPRERGIGLDRAQFFDFATGWISGQRQSRLPRDPFLLVTTDGGETWRTRPISAESRPGAIDQFAFDSRQHGQLLLDRVRRTDEGSRYELYDTRTGGASWDLVRVSDRPLPLSVPVAEQPGWRVRPDNAGKVLHLEQQREKGWATVARFAIPVGACTGE